VGELPHINSRPERGASRDSGYILLGERVGGKRGSGADWPRGSNGLARLPHCRPDPLPRRDADVGHHSSIGPGGSPVTIEAGPVVGRAPVRGGGTSQAESARLLQQVTTQVEVPGSGTFCGRAAAGHHFTSYFITFTANTYAAMHYHIGRWAPSRRQQSFQTPLEDTPCSPSPAGVEQGDPPAWRHEVYGDAVGDGDGEENAGGGGDPAVDAFYLDPAAPGVDIHQLDPVHLVAERDRSESCHLPPQREPAIHYLTDWLPAPETEVKAPSGYPGDNAELFAPTGDLESGDGTG
jgi:hypothetical protein